jgi:hypothetical protein
LIIGRIFAGLGSLLSSSPEAIAYGVNAMSGISTAFAAALVSWITIRLSILSLLGRDEGSRTGVAARRLPWLQPAWWLFGHDLQQLHLVF